MSYNRGADLLSKDISSKRLRTEIPLVGYIGWSPVIAIEEELPYYYLKVVDWINDGSNTDAGTKPVLGTANYIGTAGYVTIDNALQFWQLNGAQISHTVTTVGNLPLTGVEGEITYVEDDKELYIWTGSTWELVGTLTIDVTNKVDKVVTPTANAIVLFNGTSGAQKDSEITIESGSDDLTNSDALIPTSKRVKWYIDNLSVAYGGESLNTDGYAIYRVFSNGILEFFGLNAASNKVSIVEDEIHGTLDIDIEVGNIQHQQLNGAGSYTHSQIDTHLGSTTNPHSVTLEQVLAVDTTAGNSKITDLGNPTLSGDAVNKNYVDTYTGGLYKGRAVSSVWNMDTTFTKNVTISYTGNVEEFSIDKVWILNTAGTELYPLDYVKDADGSVQGGVDHIAQAGNLVTVYLKALENGSFDDAAFNAAVAYIYYTHT